MAITIEQSPSAMTPASNPVNWVFSSTNSAQDNFSLIIELYINGSLHSTHQTFIEENGLSRFNAEEILRAYVFSDLIPDGSILLDYTDSYASAYVVAYEKYGTPPTVTANTATSSTMYVFNGALRHKDFINFSYTDYDISVASNTSFLTDFPSAETYWCGLSETMLLGMLNSGNTTVDVYALLYDSTDTLIVSDNTQLATSGRVLVSDVSPQSIIDNFAGISSGDFTNCYYYKIYFREATYIGSVFTIYIDRECTPFNSKRVHWLNKYGVWDSYSFIMYNDESTNVNRSEYQKEKGRFTASGFNYDTAYGEAQSNVVTSTDTLNLNSDWIREDKYQWLVKSLYESPKVYIEESQGVFELVIPQVDSFRQKTRFKDKLISEQLTVKRTYTYRSQLN